VSAITDRAGNHGYLRLVGRAAAALAVVVMVASGTPAAAQTAATAGPTLELVGQSAWSPVGGDFTMRLRAKGSTAGLELTLTVYQQLTSRTAFDASINGGNLGSPRNQVTVPFDSLSVDSAGVRSLSLGLQSQRDSGPLRLDAPQTGVYPLQVALRDSSRNDVSSFVTHVVVADITAAGQLVQGKALDVAWVWPLSTDPAYRADGTPVPKVVAELRPSGRLGSQAAAIGADQGVPLTLAPSPETLDAWAALARQQPDLSAGVAALKGAAARDQVLAGPFVTLDEPSLVAGGLGDIISNELTTGVNALESFFGARTETRTAMPGPLDATAMARVRDALVDQVVLDDRTAVPATEQYTPAHPFVLQSGGDPGVSLKAIAPDPGFERLLTGSDPPALRAAHLLAGLSLVAREQPSYQRGILVSNPSDWNAPSDFVNTVLAGLSGNPLLHPVTVDQMFAEVPMDPVHDTQPTRQLAAYQPAAPPVTAVQYAQGVASDEALRAQVGAADPRVARADRALLVVPYSGWANADGRQRVSSLLGAIGESVAAFLSGIHLPAHATVTLTSSRAEIPITFRNDTGQPVNVHVRLQSDKLIFPDGTDRDVTLPPRNSTVRFTVETRSSGTFPLVLTVTTADGVTIQQTRVKVRSTFVSGVGLFITVGAVVFLGVWWGFDIRRRRRRRRAAPSPRPVRAASPEPA